MCRLYRAFPPISRRVPNKTRKGGPLKEQIGVAVYCTVCGRRKTPIGRSAPLELAGNLCHDTDCSGYRLEPYPGELWPNETREDFGY